jgi:signal transduction histidine kinase/PAS domain-containing protein/ActR/RegA family two-component response regulator
MSASAAPPALLASATPEGVNAWLSERLIGETDPLEILGIVAETLGRALVVSRVAYGEVEPGIQAINIPLDWVDGTPSMVGRYPFDHSGPFYAEYASGRTMVVSDVLEMPVPAEQAALLAQTDSRSFIGVPMMEQGQVAGLFSAISKTVRTWSREEVQLVEQVAARTWSALRHARVVAKLRESDEQFRTLAENIPAICWLAWPSGDVLWRNKLGNDMFGGALTRPDEIADLIHPDDLAMALKVWGKAHRYGVPAEVVTRMRCLDGGYRPFLSKVEPVRDAAGVIQRLCGVQVDLSEQYRRERHENFFRRVSDEIRDETDAHAILGVVSAMLKDHLGASRVMYSEFTDAETFTFDVRREAADSDLPPAQSRYELPPAFGPMVAAFARGETVHIDDMSVLSDHVTEEVREFYCSRGVASGLNVPLVKDGRLVASLTIHSRVARAWRPDEIHLVEELAERTWSTVTRAQAEAERKRAEIALECSREALYQTEKLSALGSLLAGVSHELNNPLSIIVAQAELLDHQAAGTALAERAGKIRKAAERSARIVQTFLAMARQRTPQRKPVALNEVVASAIELTTYGLRSNGVELRTQLAENLPTMMADADQLHQVVVNLIVNAQQAMQDHPGPRRLTLATGLCDGADRLWLKISDTGPGVPAKLTRRIFEPFFTTKPLGVGTGVGLSFSLGLVEAHGGRLEILDVAEGATFQITLPIGAEAALAETLAQAAHPAATGRRRALVVDDEPEIAQALAELLALENFETVIARGGVEAQARLREDDFELVLSDLRMPDLDGPALFAWINMERPDLVQRTAFSTGDTLGPSAVRFLTRAGCPFMEKPFTRAALRKLIEEVDSQGTPKP